MTINKQEQLLLDHMEQKGSISTLEAIRLYNIVRPGARISDLRSKGFNIKTELVYRKRRDGRQTHFAVYSLVKS